MKAKPRYKCGAAVRRAPLISALAAAVWMLLPAAAGATTYAAGCTFQGGFKILHDLASAQVGDCVTDQAYSASGDAQQLTTRGMMVWRKADNWTAFTDGYRTWINGPFGLQVRLNTDRFPWESQDLVYPDMTADFLAMLNSDRQQNGLAPLAPDPLLSKLAQTRGQQVLQNGGSLDHYAPDGKLAVEDLLDSAGSSYRLVGENLASESSPSSGSTARANGDLMGSAPHRANILNPAYRQVGVAVAARNPAGPFVFVQVFADMGG